MAIRADKDPTNLSEAGWGVIFAHDADPAIREALGELLALRQRQAGDVYRIFEGSQGGHRPDETKNGFLGRYGVGLGPAEPEKVPYYLLIVGDPQRIPYSFQSQLDVAYAVGRIHFDTLEEYSNYARSVVASETSASPRPELAAFFSPANDGDRATELITKDLVAFTYEGLEKSAFSDLTAYLSQDATKNRLGHLLGGESSPALLFAAGHGLTFPSGHPRQLAHQGALLCQDWPGPGSWRGEIRPDHYFSGDDLRSDADLTGMIAFFYASYSAGAPKTDEFANQASRADAKIAPRAFVAGLPIRMLSQPSGGALAFIGLVDRALAFSYEWPQVHEQAAVFDTTLRHILAGNPVGYAVEVFQERYAQLATRLTLAVEDIELGMNLDPQKVASMWTSSSDARGLVVVGDPAARLQVA